MAGRKYPIYDRAPEAPFKCIISGLAGPVIDLDKFIPNYGRVYLSVNVIAAVAAAHGFLNDRESAELRADAAAAREEADRWPAVLKEFVDGVDALVARAGARAVGGGAVDHLDGGAAPGLAADQSGDGFVADAAGAGDGSAVEQERGGVPANADVPFDQPAVFSE